MMALGTGERLMRVLASKDKIEYTKLPMDMIVRNLCVE